MRPACRLLLACVAAAFLSADAMSQSPAHYSGEIEWDEPSATVTFRTSGVMPDSKEGFFWNVPATVKRIIIGENVRVTGGFRILYRKKENPLHITGESRETSVVFGTDQQAWTARNSVAENDKWKYSTISVIEDAVVHVSNLTALNPRGYIISGYASQAVIHVDSCSLLDTRDGDNNNSDGFAGAAGSSLKNCLICTADDGIKIYNDITIENVTIEHHRNGAPLQFGWGGESKRVKAEIKGLLINGVDPEHRYNMAPLTWERGHAAVRKVSIDGLEVQTQGQLYNEEQQSWGPIGLLELKPSDCEFNLTVINAKLHGLPLGLNKTTGAIKIAEEADSE